MDLLGGMLLGGSLFGGSPFGGSSSDMAAIASSLGILGSFISMIWCCEDDEVPARQRARRQSRPIMPRVSVRSDPLANVGSVRLSGDEVNGYRGGR